MTIKPNFYTMKKLIFALAAIALAACSNEETIELNRTEAISFDKTFVDNSTRSVVDPSFTNENLFTDFAVFGHVQEAVLFNGVTVSKTITNGDLSSAWKYEGTQYWITGAKYNFSALAPKTNGGWSNAATSVNDEFNTITTTFDFTNNGTTDLLYSEFEGYEGKLTSNEQVAFTFRHILSKVKFSFENAYNASAATLRVYDVKITNAYKTAKAELNVYKYSNGQTVNFTNWENQAQATDFILDFGAATDDEATTNKENDATVAFEYGKTYETQKELFLIPGMIHGGYNVTFKVDLLVNDTKITTYEHTATVTFTPAAGYSYDIKAVVNAENIDPESKQEPIEFTVTSIGGWTPAEVDDILKVEEDDDNN